MMKDNKNLRRSVHRAMDAMSQAAGDVVGNVTSICLLYTSRCV